MRPSRGRSIARGCGAAAVLLIAAGTVACRETLRELWAIHIELRPADRRRAILEGNPDPEDRRRAAIEWLEARRSIRAAPHLLHIAGREDRPLRKARRERREGDGLDLPELALRALRSLSLGEDWYIARLAAAGVGQREVVIRELGLMGSRKSVASLEEIAREDGPLGPVAAAALARILPSLELVEVIPGKGKARTARFRLRNPAPRSIWFEGYTLDDPIRVLRSLQPRGWVQVLGMPTCGTGIEDIELPPGASTVFEQPFQETRSLLQLGIILVDPPLALRGEKFARRTDEILREMLWTPVLATPELPP